MYEKNPLWLGVDMLNLLSDFTCQNWLIIAKRFDNPMVVKTFGNYQSVLVSEVR